MTEDDELPEDIERLIGRCEINETSFSNDDMSRALEFGERAWQAIPRWVHVEERLPENGTVALFYAPELCVRPFVGSFANGWLHVWRGQHEDMEKVTHWAPLLESPTEPPVES